MNGSDHDRVDRVFPGARSVRAIALHQLLIGLEYLHQVDAVGATLVAHGNQVVHPSKRPGLVDDEQPVDGFAIDRSGDRNPDRPNKAPDEQTCDFRRVPADFRRNPDVDVCLRVKDTRDEFRSRQLPRLDEAARRRLSGPLEAVDHGRNDTRELPVFRMGHLGKPDRNVVLVRVPLAVFVSRFKELRPNGVRRTGKATISRGRNVAGFPEVMDIGQERGEQPKRLAVEKGRRVRPVLARRDQAEFGQVGEHRAVFRADRRQQLDRVETRLGSDQPGSPPGRAPDPRRQVVDLALRVDNDQRPGEGQRIGNGNAGRLVAPGSREYQAVGVTFPGIKRDQPALALATPTLPVSRVEVPVFPRVGQFPEDDPAFGREPAPDIVGRGPFRV